MASAELNRRVGKVVAYPPISTMSGEQRREFHEALLDANAFEDLAGKWQAAILEAEQNRPKLRIVGTLDSAVVGARGSESRHLSAPGRCAQAPRKMPRLRLVDDERSARPGACPRSDNDSHETRRGEPQLRSEYHSSGRSCAREPVWVCNLQAADTRPGAHALPIEAENPWDLRSQSERRRSPGECPNFLAPVGHLGLRGPR
jgi:hypothetical protein